MMKNYLHNYITGVSYAFTIFSVGFSIFFKDKTFDDWQGQTVFETKSDREKIQKALKEIEEKGEIGSKTVQLSKGRNVEVFVN